MTLVLVMLGGAIGAPLRYLTDLLVQSRHDGAYPWGTFTVNVVGSGLLGLVAGGVTTVGTPHWVLAVVGTGFCGALTTFSTFGYETVRLIEEGSAAEALLNAGLSLGIGLAFASAGWAFAGLLG
jgi:CrcB protein